MTTHIEAELQEEARREWQALFEKYGGGGPTPPRPPRPPEPHMETVEQGKAYRYRGKPYIAGLVNPCRCRLDPLFRSRRVIRDNWTMETVEILTRPPSVSIAAGAQLEPLIIERRK